MRRAGQNLGRNVSPSEPAETIPEYLLRVRRKDVEKGYDGYRTTRQVADFYGIGPGAARRRLEALISPQGPIICRRDGQTLVWRSKAK